MMGADDNSGNFNEKSADKTNDSLPIVKNSDNSDDVSGLDEKNNTTPGIKPSIQGSMEKAVYFQIEPELNVYEKDFDSDLDESASEIV